MLLLQVSLKGIGAPSNRLPWQPIRSDYRRVKADEAILHRLMHPEGRHDSHGEKVLMVYQQGFYGAIPQQECDTKKPWRKGSQSDLCGLNSTSGSC